MVSLESLPTHTLGHCQLTGFNVSGGSEAHPDLSRLLCLTGMTTAQREAVIYTRSQSKRLAESGLEPWLSDTTLHSFSTDEQADNPCFMLGGVGQPSNGARGR